MIKIIAIWGGIILVLSTGAMAQEVAPSPSPATDKKDSPATPRQVVEDTLDMLARINRIADSISELLRLARSEADKSAGTKILPSPVEVVSRRTYQGIAPVGNTRETCIEQ